MGRVFRWVWLIAFLATACAAEQPYAPHDGDIVFQTSRSAQSTAIQRATHSPYSHMGIVNLRNGAPFVFEAVEPVKLTPLEEWVKRGRGGHFVVKRLRDAAQVLTPTAIRRMVEVGRTFEGRHYDLTFEWSDDRVYCSELVWKVYERALGLRLGELQVIGDFDLSDPLVEAKVRERWGGQPPADEPVISPAAMFESGLLVTVYSR
jgi:hypothetical protein